MRRFFRKGHRIEFAALTIFAAVAAAGLPSGGSLKAALFAFAAAAFLYSGAIVALLEDCDAEELPVLAARHDRRAPHILVAGLLLDFASLALVVTLIATRAMDAFATALAGVSILGAWTLLNLLFAVHYAHMYFTALSPPISFPGAGRRTFSDFLYFSFVIGMTSQVSDAAVIDAGLRRLVLAHSLLAFVFNVFVVALAVNVLAGLSQA